jgi:hypothetical protein
MIIALRGEVQQRKLRVVKIDRHVRPCVSCAGRSGSSLTLAPDRSDRGEGFIRTPSVSADVDTHALFRIESQPFLSARVMIERIDQPARERFDDLEETIRPPKRGRGGQ